MSLITARTTDLRTIPLDVIVADDEPADNLLFTLAANDSDTDMQITFAADGVELLRILTERMLDRRAPDLVVLDLRMPKCTGLEAMEAIAASDLLRDVPVVMFTTSRREADIRRATELGVLRFVTKPSSYSELVAFMAELSDIASEAGCTGSKFRDDGS
jgi:CheY-like chemotaxis protein